MRKPLINPGIIKRLKSFFAIIQDTDTATRYIPAGKYVLYKNIACHASQNIESGDTLALGTNLVTDSDGFVNCLNDGLTTLNSNIATKIPFYRYTISDYFPTATNIQNFFNIETGVKGIFAVGFAYDGLIRSTLYYSAVNNKYGAGVLVSYYGDQFANVVNANGTVTITNSDIKKVYAASLTPAHSSISSILVRKNCQVVTMRIDSNGTGVNIQNGAILGSIPAGYRPAIRTIVPIFIYSSGKLINGSLWLESGGDIFYYGDAITTQCISFASFIES